MKDIITAVVLFILIAIGAMDLLYHSASFILFLLKKLKNKTSKTDLEAVNDFEKMFKYIEIDEGIIITEIITDIPELTIPDDLNNVKIIGIGKNNVNVNSKQFSLTLGENITFIDTYAFENSYFEYVDMKNCCKLKEISSFSFYKCESLLKIDLPDSIEVIKNHAFSYCPIKSIDIPNVRIIGESAFCGSGFNEFNGSSNLEFIGNDIFKYCRLLVNIDLSQSKVSRIPLNCFYYCDNLKFVKLPASVRQISKGAFTDCDNLKKIILHSKPTIIKQNCEPFYSALIYKAEKIEN